MKRILFITAIFLFSVRASSFAQQDSFPRINAWLMHHKAIQNYVNFLKRDSTQRNTYILASYNFMFTNQGNIAHGGRGGYLSAGLNVARFFSRKFVLGAVVELKAWKGLWPHYFSKDFINDFNAAYQNNLTGADSSRAEVLKACINGSPSYTRRGTFYSAFGIAFSPFPNKYGGFMLIAKTASLGIPVHGTYGTLFNKNGTDWVSISVPGLYSFELVCKPLTFFKATKSDRANGILQLSVFVQRLNWKNANFDGLPLSRITQGDFMNKYATQDHYGITIKIGLY